MQKTDFPFVAIVHDDTSTDKTAEIIKEYAEGYPNIILPIYEDENQYSKGTLGKVMSEACKATGAEYIAMCEGDDYWTDPLKLQKQVDFLELHLEYSFSCHRFSIYDARSDKWHNEYGYALYNGNQNLDIDMKLFMKYWVTQPLTAVYRKSSWDGYNLFSSEFKYTRDVHLFYYLLTKGKGISLNENMGVYRWHDGGVAIGSDNNKRIKTAYNVYKELYYATKDKRLLKVYYNYLISYYLIEDDKLIKKHLFTEASNITSFIRVYMKLFKRKIGSLIRAIGLYQIDN